MDDQDDQATSKGQWTIKGVPTETRRLAMALSAKLGDPVAVVVTRALRVLEQMEQGERIILPAPRGGAPSTAVATVPGHARPADVDLPGLTGLLREVREMAVASKEGVPLPKGMMSHAMALTVAELRRARGMPVRRTSGKKGHTIQAEPVDFPTTTAEAA